MKITYPNKADMTTTSVPSYNKVSANDMNEIKTVVNANDNKVGTGTLETTANNCVDAINEVRSGLYVEEILWTNNDTSTSFGTQSVTLSKNLSNYEDYEILFLQSTTVGRIMTSGHIPVGYGTILSYVTTVPCFRPTGENVTGTTLSFENAKNQDGTTNNTGIIPYMIIGRYRIGDD